MRNLREFKQCGDVGLQSRPRLRVVLIVLQIVVSIRQCRTALCNPGEIPGRILVVGADEESNRPTDANDSSLTKVSNHVFGGFDLINGRKLSLQRIEAIILDQLFVHIAAIKIADLFGDRVVRILRRLFNDRPNILSRSIVQSRE